MIPLFHLAKLNYWVLTVKCASSLHLGLWIVFVIVTLVIRVTIGFCVNDSSSSTGFRSRITSETIIWVCSLNRWHVFVTLSDATQSLSLILIQLIFLFLSLFNWQIFEPAAVISHCMLQLEWVIVWCKGKYFSVNLVMLQLLSHIVTYW